MLDMASPNNQTQPSMFTADQLQALHQQYQLQNQQRANKSNDNNNNNNNNINAPYVVMTQLPLNHATPFLLQAQQQQQQQQQALAPAPFVPQQQQQAVAPPPQQQQQQHQPNLADWTNLLQPTPLGNTIQQQQQQQQGQQQPPQTITPQQQQQQPNGMDAMLQLFQQQQQQLQQNNNNNSSGLNSSSQQHQQQGLFTLGSTVEPVQHHSGTLKRSDSSCSEILGGDMDLFKGFWDDDDNDNNISKPSDTSNTNAGKRKCQWGASPMQSPDQLMATAMRLQQQHQQGLMPSPPFAQEQLQLQQQHQQPTMTVPQQNLQQANLQQQQQSLQQQQLQQQHQMQQQAIQQQRSQSVDMMDHDSSNKGTSWDPTPLSHIQASPMSTCSMNTTTTVEPNKSTLPNLSMNERPTAPRRSVSMPPTQPNFPLQPQTTTQQQQQQQQQHLRLQQSPQVKQMQAQVQAQQQQQQPQPIQPQGAQNATQVQSDSGKVPFPDQKYAFLLPSTLMPPSVLASVLPSSEKNTDANKGGGTNDSSRYKKKRGRKSTRVESPQDCLDRILSLQGYGGVARVTSEEAQYETVPSPLQLASFGTELVKAIHTSNTDRLSQLLETGLSPNPCNKFRDSIVDLVCKRANGEIFRCLVDHGSDLRVCDGFGRTPLHHCCWASEFSTEIAETILRVDWQQLFIEDKRGQTPLEYVRPDQASDWVEFLEDNRDRFFPVGGAVPALQAVKQGRPDNSLPDPPNALPVQLASAISSGQLSPEELDNLDPELRVRFK